MNKQRDEDINPANNDIEEKIKQMLDPSIPDEVDESKSIKISTKPKNPTKIIAVSSPLENDANATKSSDTNEIPSAPELPDTAHTSKDDKSKKVIIPISHHDSEEHQNNNEVDKQTSSQKEPSIKKISITDNEESPEVLADKLTKTIAELDQKNPKTNEDMADSNLTKTTSNNQSEIQKSLDTVEKYKSTEKIPELDVISSPSTDKAVAEIVASEGDELLEIEDAVRDTDAPVKPNKKPRKSLHSIFKKLWAKSNFRWSVVGLFIASILAISLVPGSRYFLLNTAGVRAKSSIVVLDQTTQLPLKNVSVTIGDNKGTTDKEGRVSLQKLKLGNAILKIEKRAFASINQNIVIGLGSNPLGDFGLTPTGSQYSFIVTDYLSGKPIEKAEASSGEASALSDNKGVITLTTENLSDENIDISINADTYRTEKFNLDPNDNSTRNIKLVPDKKHIFVSKRTGKYDIFSVYIDGKDEKLELGGSGKEKEGMVLVHHPSAPVVAYISTRAGQNNSDGFTLSNLIMINTSDSTTTNVGASERIQILEWFGDSLVYVQISAGSSANSPKRYRLLSYNYRDGSSKELASSNYFNDVIAINNKIYYAPASAYQTGGVGLVRINADGSDQRTIFDQEVWNIFRTSYEDLALSVQQNWYKYHIGDNSPTKQNTAPANQASRIYIESPSGKNSIWVEVRDGKGTLISYDHESKKDTVLTSQSGLKLPARWLNNSTIVYRVETNQEIADYAISLDGGNAVKIGDVTNSGGLDRWNY